MLEHQPFSNSVVLSSKKAVVVIYTISGVRLLIRLGLTRLLEDKREPQKRKKFLGIF